MKLATLCHIPGPHFGHPQAFIKNLSAHPSKHPVIPFSSHPWMSEVKPWPFEELTHIGNPEVLSTARNPDGTQKSYAISNLIFLTSLRIAASKGISHMIYMEPDSRVGPGWDDIIFNTFFRSGRPTVLGGSICCYGPCASGIAAAMRWVRFVREADQSVLPVVTYGRESDPESRKTCVFSMGSLSVIDVPFIASLFDLSNTGGLAASIGPYDLELGFRLWEQYGRDSYELVHHIPEICSTYGSDLLTEQERLALLRSNKVAAVHQVKSEEI